MKGGVNMDTSAVINTSLVNEVIGVVKSGLGLFEVFPLNVTVIAGIIAIGIGLVVSFIPRRH